MVQIGHSDIQNVYIVGVADTFPLIVVIDIRMVCVRRAVIGFYCECKYQLLAVELHKCIKKVFYSKIQDKAKRWNV